MQFTIAYTTTEGAPYSDPRMRATEGRRPFETDDALCRRLINTGWGYSLNSGDGLFMPGAWRVTDIAPRQGGLTCVMRHPAAVTHYIEIVGDELHAKGPW